MSDSPTALEVSVGLPEVLAGLPGPGRTRRSTLGGLLAEGLLDELAGVPALAAGEALGLDGRLALGADGDLDGLQDAPPTWMVSLMDAVGEGLLVDAVAPLSGLDRGLAIGIACKKASRCLGSPH